MPAWDPRPDAPPPPSGNLVGGSWCVGTGSPGRCVAWSRTRTAAFSFIAQERLRCGTRRADQKEPRMSNIFVFGSNLAGRHGAGSARAAVLNHGAIYGQAFGRQGMSF